ncbi:MAG: caspase family protein, partial [Myxococcaceae bacterium]
MRWAAFALILCSLASVAWGKSPARRLALIVGNNRGVAGEVPLLYAERDALRVAEVLRDLGEVDPADTHTVLGGRAPEVRSALQRLTQRASTVEKTVLFLYYSG